MAESVEDVLAEIERGLFRDAVVDQTIRLRAALERERAAVLRVADWVADRCCCNDAVVPCKYMMEQAAALRKAVGR